MLAKVRSIVRMRAASKIAQWEKQHLVSSRNSRIWLRLGNLVWAKSEENRMPKDALETLSSTGHSAKATTHERGAKEHLELGGQKKSQKAGMP